MIDANEASKNVQEARERQAAERKPNPYTDEYKTLQGGIIRTSRSGGKMITVTYPIPVDQINELTSKGFIYRPRSESIIAISCWFSPIYGYVNWK